MLTITGIPAFSDNYLWCVHDEKNAIIVDPGCAKSVDNYLIKHNLNLVAILITHHHPDHIGGVVELKAKYNPQIFGFKHAKFDFLDHPLIEGDTFKVLGLDFSVIEVPGHTLDHIAFYTNIPHQHTSGQATMQSSLFCGDTLFSGGCGRLFEGTAEQMLNSLKKLKALPQNTLIYCAHEYTLKNLEFAKTLMPDNENLERYFEECKDIRQRQLPTIPTTLAREEAINPFLREYDPEIKESLHTQKLIKEDSDVAVFKAIRKAKDTF